MEPNNFAADALTEAPNGLAELRQIFAGVELVRVAAANYTGTATYYFNAAAPGPSAQGGLREGKQAAKKFTAHPSTTVPVTTVDAVIDGLPKDAAPVQYIPYFKVSVCGRVLASPRHSVLLVVAVAVVEAAVVVVVVVMVVAVVAAIAVATCWVWV